MLPKLISGTKNTGLLAETENNAYICRRLFLNKTQKNAHSNSRKHRQRKDYADKDAG